MNTLRTIHGNHDDRHTLVDVLRHDDDRKERTTSIDEGESAPLLLSSSDNRGTNHRDRASSMIRIVSRGEGNNKDDDNYRNKRYYSNHLDAYDDNRMSRKGLRHGGLSSTLPKDFDKSTLSTLFETHFTVNNNSSSKSSIHTFPSDIDASMEFIHIKPETLLFVGGMLFLFAIAMLCLAYAMGGGREIFWRCKRHCSSYFVCRCCKSSRDNNEQEAEGAAAVSRSEDHNIAAQYETIHEFVFDARDEYDTTTTTAAAAAAPPVMVNNMITTMEQLFPDLLRSSTDELQNLGRNRRHLQPQQQQQQQQQHKPQPKAHNETPPPNQSQGRTKNLFRSEKDENDDANDNSVHAQLSEPLL